MSLAGFGDGDCLTLLADHALAFATLLGEGAGLPAAILADDGRVLQANRALTGMLGREIVGLDLTEVLIPTCHEAFLAAKVAPGRASFTLLHLARREGPVSLHCLIEPLGAGHLILGEALVHEERALRDQLQDLNRELAVLTRENARRAQELERTQRDLDAARRHLQKVGEVLPMCLACRRVRTGPDAWEDAATFLSRSTELLSHGYCADCATRLDAALDEAEKAP